MDKVRIKFKASKFRQEYWSQTLHLTDGKTVLVHQKTAERLIGHFPSNFERVSVKPGKLGKKLRRKLKLNQISLICIYNNKKILEKNLASNLPKEIEFLPLDNTNNQKFSSAAQGLNFGIKKAKNNTVVCCHQDVIFTSGWWGNFVEQECRLGNWGALGIAGSAKEARRWTWGYNLDVPKEIETLDECCIILNKKNRLFFDEKNFNKFHCYGIDICLQARNKGLSNFVIAGEVAHQCGQNLKSNWLEQTAPFKEAIQKKWGDKFGEIHTTLGVIK